MGIETLAIAAIATSVLGAGVSAYGQYQSGQASAAQATAAAQAQANQYQYQAAVAEINRQQAERNTALAERNAAYVEQAGATQIEERGRRIRSVLGAQRAALAANGLLTDTGTGLDLQDDAAELGGLAVNEIGNNAARQASGYRISALNAESEAEMAGMRGDFYDASASNALTAGAFGAGQARTAGTFGVASSLLGGASRAFDAFGDMRRSGVPMPQVPRLV